MLFVPDEIMHAVASGEAFDEVVPVLPDAHDQVGRDADVEGAVVVAGEEVDAGLLHASKHEAERRSWVPAFAGMTGGERLRQGVGEFPGRLGGFGPALVRESVAFDAWRNADKLGPGFRRDDGWGKVAAGCRGIPREACWFRSGAVARICCIRCMAQCGQAGSRLSPG